MNKRHFLALLTALIVWSCNTESQKKDGDETSHHATSTTVADPRVSELMAIHDSIMPAMGTIMNLKKKVSANLFITDSLIAVQSTEALKKQRTDAQDLQTRLDEADRAMMGWMHQYKGDTLKKLDSAQAEAYIADQKQKIVTVRELMENIIAEATLYVQKQPTP
jgi:hypothetical protein